MRLNRDKPSRPLAARASSAPPATPASTRATPPRRRAAFSSDVPSAATRKCSPGNPGRRRSNSRTRLKSSRMAHSLSGGNGMQSSGAATRASISRSPTHRVSLHPGILMSQDGRVRGRSPRAFARVGSCECVRHATKGPPSIIRPCVRPSTRSCAGRGARPLGRDGRRRRFACETSGPA